MAVDDGNFLSSLFGGGASPGSSGSLGGLGGLGGFLGGSGMGDTLGALGMSLLTSTDRRTPFATLPQMMALQQSQSKTAGQTEAIKQLLKSSGFSETEADQLAKAGPDIAKLAMSQKQQQKLSSFDPEADIARQSGQGFGQMGAAPAARSPAPGSPSPLGPLSNYDAPSAAFGDGGLASGVPSMAGQPMPTLPPTQTAGPGDMGGFQKAIANVESGGRYDALGPATRTGDRAIGKYQVMASNVGPWSKEVLGREVTPQEFMSSPELQNAVFNGKFGQYVQKYGPEGAAKAWFAGEGGMKNPNAKDSLGTTVDAYAKRFMSGLPAGAGQDAPVTSPTQVASTDPNFMPSPATPNKALDDRMLPGLGLSRLPDSAVVPADQASPPASQMSLAQAMQSRPANGGQAGFSTDQAQPAPMQVAPSAQAPSSSAPNLDPLAAARQQAAVKARTYGKYIDMYTAMGKTPPPTWVEQYKAAQKLLQPTDIETALASAGIQPGTPEYRKAMLKKAGIGPTEFQDKLDQAFPDPNDPRRQIAAQAAVQMGPTDASKKLDELTQRGIVKPGNEDYTSTAKTLYGVKDDKEKAPTFGVIGKNSLGQDTYGWRDPSTKSVTPYAPPADANSPGQRDVSVTGNDFLQTLDPARQAQIKQMVEGRSPPPSAAALRSPYVQQLVADANQYDPTFDQTTWTARNTTHREFSAGGPNSPAAQITAGNTSIQHLGDLSDAAEKLGNRWFTPWNTLTNTVGQTTGDPRVDTFNDWRNRYAQEITKFYRGTGGSEADIKRDIDALNSSKSPDQLRAVLAAQAEGIQAKVNALQERWHQGMGPNVPDFPIVQDKSKAALDKIFSRHLGTETPKAGADKPDASNGNTTSTGVTWSIK